MPFSTDAATRKSHRSLRIELYATKTMNPIPSILHKISTLVDGSVRITLDTREMDSKAMAELFDLRGREGYAFFSPDPIQEVSIPDQPAEQGKKTQSQRLRAVLYILWEQQGAKGDFNTFYDTQMNRLIDFIKQKLD